MVVSLPVWTVLTKLELLIDYRKYLMKELCVIYSGQILMTDVAGASHQEELDIHLEKTYQSSLIIQMGYS